MLTKEEKNKRNRKYMKEQRDWFKKNYPDAYRKMLDERNEQERLKRIYIKENNPEEYKKNREKDRIRKLKIRKIVFEYYGNKCQCCGIDTYEFLCIDHINNDGCIQRQKKGRKDVYNYAIKNNFPNDLQILCHNCNLAKGIYGKCPHKKEY